MPSQTASPTMPSDLKYGNRRQIFNAFSEDNSYSLNDLAARTGLSRQTVTKSIQFFLKHDILQSAGKGQSTRAGGKRPEYYALSSTRYFILVAIWPTVFSIQIRTLGNKLMDELVLYQPLPESAATEAENIGKLSHVLLSKNSIPLDSVCGVCISTGGIVDYRNGNIRYNAQMASWGNDIPLRDLVAPYFSEQTHILIQNAVKIGANPYLTNPAYAGKRLLVISSGRGFSGCLISDQVILNGKHNLIGELGHTTLDPESDVVCSCGSRGCFSRLISLTNMKRKIKNAAALFPDSGLLSVPEDQLTIPVIFQFATDGDALACDLVTFIATKFAILFRNVSLVFDPEYVIFQGDYAQANKLFTDVLIRKLKEFRYYPEGDPFQMVFEKRTLDELNAQGSYIALLRDCLNQGTLFPDTDETEEK